MTKGESRYFCGLSLFMFSMLGIVLANNFIMMFIFWELVGVSSYLLIGHWFYHAAPPDAANKAFLANRIGDFGFMLGILLVWSASGTVSFEELQPALVDPRLESRVHDRRSSADFLRSGRKIGPVPAPRLAAGRHGGPDTCLCLNPCRHHGGRRCLTCWRVSFFLFQPAPAALTVVLWIGLVTSLMAALMATQQDDIKRILAYSTLSQLGYMVAAVGLGAPQAAHVPPLHSCFLQGSSIPWRRRSDLQPASRAGHLANGRSAETKCRSPFGPFSSARWL